MTPTFPPHFHSIFKLEKKNRKITWNLSLSLMILESPLTGSNPKVGESFPLSSLSWDEEEVDVVREELRPICFSVNFEDLSIMFQQSLKNGSLKKDSR